MLPLYQQIREYIHNLIDDQGLLANEKLPSERELVEVFQSTRITVREALIRLESEGVIYRANRRGWFIAPERFVLDLTKIHDFHQSAIDQERSADFQLVYAKKVGINPQLKRLLNTRKSTYFCVCRSKYLEGRSIAVEHVYIDAKKFPKFEKIDPSSPLNSALKKEYSVSIARSSYEIQVEALDEENAELLETNNGAPCVKILRQSFDKKGQLIMVTVDYWIHNAVNLQLH